MVRQTATDIERWEQTAKEIPRWDQRNLLITSILNRLAPRIVVDFGAGSQTIKRYLHSNVRYQPIDCVQTNSETFVCDYNTEFKLPANIEKSFYVFSGFFEYIVELDCFLETLRKASSENQCVFSYAVAPSDLQRRRSNGWLNHLGNKIETGAFFGKHFQNLQHVADWNGQMIFVGKLRVFEEKIA
jgi:hypothetical protein